MCRFEEHGMKFQIEAKSRSQADSAFARSCEACCNRGIHLECDRCRIRVVHEQVLAFFEPAVPSIRFQVGVQLGYHAC